MVREVLAEGGHDEVVFCVLQRIVELLIRLEVRSSADGTLAQCLGWCDIIRLAGEFGVLAWTRLDAATLLITCQEGQHDEEQGRCHRYDGERQRNVVVEEDRHYPN